MDNNANICFLFMIYNDWDLAKRLVSQLTQYFPNSDVVCIADGTHSPSFEDFCGQSMQYICGEQRLYLQEFGGQWSERAFAAYLECSEKPYLIRVDPDIWINRPFDYLPSSEIGGSVLCTNDGRKYVQGGCVFYRRETVVKILESGYLKDRLYAIDPRFGYKRFSRYKTANETLDHRVCKAEDHIVAHVAQRLNLSVEDWGDVCCRFRDKCLQPEKYAVVHPVKNL